MMRKQLGLMTSLVFLLATAALWMGCTHDWSRNGPVCAAPCQPVCSEPCAPDRLCGAREPCARSLHTGLPSTLQTIARCHYPSCNELCCRDGIIVSARNPSMCMLGDQYPLEFDIKACDDVCDVAVVTHLPDGVSL